nr:MAK10-like protein [Tanacetum cinerariifolium]
MDSFQELTPKVHRHGIDLWLQIQIFYDHVNPITRRTIDQAAHGKLRDKNDEQSRELLEHLAFYDNESWNDPRDFAKLIKAISMPQDVLSTSDQNPEQAFVEYVSSRTNQAGGVNNNGAKNELPSLLSLTPYMNVGTLLPTTHLVHTWSLDCFSPSQPLFDSASPPLHSVVESMVMCNGVLNQSRYNTLMGLPPSPALVLDENCIINRDYSKFAMGRVKDANSIPNLLTLLFDEGFSNIKLKYLGGLWEDLSSSDDDSVQGEKHYTKQLFLSEEEEGEFNATEKKNVVEACVPSPSLSHPPGVTPVGFKSEFNNVQDNGDINGAPDKILSP